MSDESLSLEAGENLGTLERVRERNAALRRELAATESSLFTKLGTVLRRILKR